MAKGVKNNAEYQRLLAAMKDPNFIAQQAQALGIKVAGKEKPTFKAPAFEGQVDIPDGEELTPKALKEILGKAMGLVVAHVDKAVAAMYDFQKKEVEEAEAGRTRQERSRKIQEFRAKHPDFDEHLEEIQRQFQANGGDIEKAYNAALKLAGKKPAKVKDGDEEEEEDDDEEQEEEDDEETPLNKRPRSSIPSDGSGDDDPPKGTKRKPKKGDIRDIIGANIDAQFKKSDFEVDEFSLEDKE